MKQNNLKKQNFKHTKIMWVFLLALFSLSFSASADGVTNRTTYNKLSAGDLIAIKSSNSRFISSENGQKPITSNRNKIGYWEKFKLINAGHGFFALKGSNGRFISSENGKKFMTCNRKSIGWWEKFRIVRLKNGQFALKGTNGRFVSSENGNKPLKCNRKNVGPWEKFSIKILSKPFNIIVNAGKIRKTQVACGAFQPQKLIGIPAKTSNGSHPIYQWQVKNDMNSQWQNISGANAIHYTPNFANIGSKWFRRIARAKNSSKYLSSNVIDIHAREIPDASVKVTPIDCDSETGKITLNFKNFSSRLYLQFSIDNGGNFIWVDDKLGSYTFDNLSAGSYSIITKWGDGDCPVSLGTHVINDEKIPLETFTSNNQTICNRESTTLTAISEGAILWSTGETTQSITVNPEATTTYTVSATKGNCKLTDEVVVTISTPKVKVENQTICKGDTAILTAIGEGSVLWSNGATTPSIKVTPNKTTTYTATLTNNQGCTATAEATVNVHAADVKIDGPIDINICLGEEVIITATEADTYAWSTGETTQSITVAPTEDAWIFLNATKNGCNAIRQVVEILVEDSLKEATISPDATIEEGSAIQLIATGGDTYLWNDGDTNSTKTVSPIVTTNYSVLITKGNCNAEYNTTVNVTEIKDPCTKEIYNVTAFPNPISNVGDLTVNVSIKESQEITYAFYKMDGNIIGPLKTVQFASGCNEIAIDMGSHCNFKISETYFLIVNGNGWTKNIQIVTLPN
ncbi:glycoside hydrolase family 16 [Aquimarina agarivorans]|uniref:glycoside hydrolase family 16 n=1 Tax=Aquimarina agarivorans TaxID=980584 RepID=UPI000248EA64|nr:glycoside hydrolase family 16 [Aquimarina agarivorans]